ncbi:adenine nucleotide translocase lysine N-methyltransferase isoform X2 [Pseudorca crassidens]|uniref:adenine nucleotide translocase lysine N-methyltransferase isoform X2 n=1 Tax=Pseudorca crassidens TaxID=82174 RepID=UPI00352C8FE5
MCSPRGPQRPRQARSNHLRHGPTRLSDAGYRQDVVRPEPARVAPDPRVPRSGTRGRVPGPGRSGTRADRLLRLSRPLPVSRRVRLFRCGAADLVPYVGASARQVEHVLSLLRGRPGKMVDLGSGDGRIVLAAHKCGLRPAVGYELNPWLVGLAWLHAWRAGCAGNVSYRRENLWKLPLLEDKLQAELPAGARVVSGRFPLPTWQPVAVLGEGLDRVWAYDVHSGGPAGQAVPGPSSASVPGAPNSQVG